MAITEHSTKLISKVEIGGVLYDIHDAGAVHSLADLGITNPVLTFRGILDTIAELPATGNSTGDIYLVKEDSGEYIWDGSKWELMDAHIVADHTHTVIHTTKNNTASASVLETAGSVTAGSDVVFNAGSHTADSFEQGEDKFTFNPGSYTAPSLTDTYVAPSFTAGEDVFTPNVPTTIDTTKFSGGSFNQGNDTFTAGSTTFEQGTDSFTANTPTVIDINKFSAGSASITDGSASLTGAENPSWTAVVDGETLSFTWSAGSHGSVDYTAPELNYTAPKLDAGFYTPGTAASFTQGTDKFSYTAPTFKQGTDSFTAAKLNNGFYTVGSAASFVQGTDTFNAGSHSITFNEGSYTAPSASFTQGTDKFTSGVYTAPTLTGGKATKVTLPTFSTVNNIWVGEKEETLTTSEAIEAAE